MLLKNSLFLLAGLLEAKRPLFRSLGRNIASNEIPLTVKFVDESNNKYSVWVENPEFPKFLGGTTSKCAVLKASGASGTINWSACNSKSSKLTQEGRSMLWEKEEYRYQGRNMIRLFQFYDGLKLVWEINTKGRNAIVVDGQQNPYGMSFSGDFNGDASGYLTSFTSSNLASNKRQCLTYSTNPLECPIGSSKKLCRQKSRIRFMPCNLSTCNDSRVSGSECKSCNWMGNKGDECETCLDFMQYIENGNCLNIPEDAKCLISPVNIRDTGLFTPEVDEHICTNCERSDDTRCNRCFVEQKHTEIINGKLDTWFTSVQPVNGECKCPDGTVLSYDQTRETRGFNPVCVKTCLAQNDDITSEQNRCKSCDNVFPDQCKYCDYANVELLDGVCVCDRDDLYSWNVDENSCDYKYRDLMEEVKQVHTMEFCMTHDKESDRDACIAKIPYSGDDDQLENFLDHLAY